MELEGYFLSNCGGCLDTVTGVFSPGSLPPGTYELYFATAGICGGIDTITVTIFDNPNAIIDTLVNGIDITQLCENSSPQQLEVVTLNGTWSSTCGNCIDVNGIFDPSIAGPGIHTITYQFDIECGDTSSINIEGDTTTISRSRC